MQTAEASSPFVDLNILPPARRAAGSLGRIALAALALTLLGCAGLLPLFQALHTARQHTSALDAELSALSADLEAARIDLQATNDLQRRIDDTHSSLDSLAQSRREFLGDGPALSAVAETAVRGLPPGVTLTSLSGGKDGLTLSGEAPSAGLVFAYAGVLEGGATSDATIVSLAGADAGGGASVTFTITLAP
ncbi:MAG: hypothetical protein WD379_09200 [Dehalococcoidia bacterium]